MTIACNLPYHIYGYIDKMFLSQRQQMGWVEAVLFAITVPRSRAVGLTVLLENGAVYRQLPPHAWAFQQLEVGDEEGKNGWRIDQAQAWDCFGGDAQVLEYSYLKDLSVELLRNHTAIQGMLKGNYLFTLEFDNDGWSRCPEQSKCLHFIQLENGRLTLQPNDRLRWKEASFTDHRLDFTYLRRQDRVYGVEE